MELLPLWFLVLSLLLPRVCLLVGYFGAEMPSITSLHGWMPPALGILVPRALVILLIFMDHGMSPWLLVHALAMAFVYLIAGSK